MIEAFVWDKRYETGLATVDAQHRRLVELINRVGAMLATDADDTEKLRAVFADLRDYAATHFGEEQSLLLAGGVDKRHMEPHIAQHREFAEQLDTMQSHVKDMSRPAEAIQGFLSNWLVYHILGEDQVAARQLHAIRSGVEPGAAFEAACVPEETPVALLLKALQTLYQTLAAQSRDLSIANRRLESEVAERTRELVSANAKLQEEYREARELFARVEEVQRQLLQSEKMASIGQLAAGVAHEINNPIGFVNSNLGMLKKYVGDLMGLIDRYEKTEPALSETTRMELAQAKHDADLEYLRQDLGDLLKESEDGLARVKRIVQDLKDFSRVGEVEWQEANLVDGVQSTLNVVWNELKYKADIVRNLTPLPLVRCVPAQINQVFMNLLVNAAHAIETRGTITLGSGVENDGVWIEVADTGCGMTPETCRRIFEPFFTTKPVGQGTGLGLSLSYDIVKKHGGALDVASEPGKGTVFRIWLPIGGPAADDESKTATT